MTEREQKFEQMLSDVRQRYQSTVTRMEALKAQGKTKSATFRQLMGDKLTYGNILTMYELYGLIDPTWKTENAG